MKRPADAFCHIVIPAPDLEKARQFYEGVFGWTVRPNEPGPAYWFFASGNVNGAFAGTGRPAEGSVLLVLRVADMASALERIAAHGGTVTRAREAIGEADSGYDAYFLDPNGNALGIYADR